MWESKTPVEDAFHRWRSDGENKSKKKKLTCIMYFYYTFLKNRAMGKL